MKNIAIYKIILIITAICCCISLFLSRGNRQDISGTVIAKSDYIKSRYKSTKIYTEYVFAIHPDNSRLSDFDMKVPFHSYVKFDVGDKVIFYDENINKYLKDPKWYEKDRVWATIFIFLLCVICYLLICLIMNNLKDNYGKKNRRNI